MKHANKGRQPYQTRIHTHKYSTQSNGTGSNNKISIPSIICITIEMKPRNLYQKFIRFPWTEKENKNELLRENLFENGMYVERVRDVRHKRI